MHAFSLALELEVAVMAGGVLLFLLPATAVEVEAEVDEEGVVVRLAANDELLLVALLPPFITTPYVYLS
jgi:hypothetical protein